MPRYYAKKRDKIDYVAILEGIKMILVHNNSIRPVAKSCELAPASLARYVTKVKAANIDLSTATDEAIIRIIKSITVPGAKTVSKYSLTHCLAHSLTASLIHPLMHSLTDSNTHSLTYSLTYSLTHSLIHSHTHSFIYSLTYSFIHSLTHGRYLVSHSFNF